MPVYMGENGVARRANEIYVGVDGVTRSILQGFNTVNSARRQFFGRLDDISYVELRLSSISMRSVDSSGNHTGEIENTLAAANQYGSISISGTTFRVTCNTIGKDLELRGFFYAHFQDGHEHDLSYLTSRIPEYGASISFSVNWASGFNVSASGSGRWSIEGSWLAYCCGIAPHQHVDGYASGSFSPDTADNDFILSAAIHTGYGGYAYTNYTEMTLPSYINIDGHSIPLVVNNQLS